MKYQLLLQLQKRDLKNIVLILFYSLKTPYIKSKVKHTSIIYILIVLNKKLSYNFCKYFKGVFYYFSQRGRSAFFLHPYFSQFNI